MRSHSPLLTPARKVVKIFRCRHYGDQEEALECLGGESRVRLFSLESFQIHKGHNETAWTCYAVSHYAANIVRCLESNYLPCEVSLIIIFKLHTDQSFTLCTFNAEVTLKILYLGRIIVGDTLIQHLAHYLNILHLTVGLLCVMDRTARSGFLNRIYPDYIADDYIRFQHAVYQSSRLHIEVHARYRLHSLQGLSLLFNS